MKDIALQNAINAIVIVLIIGALGLMMISQHKSIEATLARIEAVQDGSN